jgi:hypothetical protein
MRTYKPRPPSDQNPHGLTLSLGRYHLRRNRAPSQAERNPHTAAAFELERRDRRRGRKRTHGKSLCPRRESDCEQAPD